MSIESRHISPRSFLRALVATLAVATSQAQVSLSGNLSDATTGPLLSGTVYHVTSNITVPTGATLTVQSGAVVKFQFDGLLTVAGTLNVNGAGPNAVHFTDLRDDTVGGDSNGDGAATLPAANWWRGIQFTNTSGASNVRGLTVRYGGRFISAFELSGSSLTLRDCRVESFGSDAYDLNTLSAPTLVNCAAVGCTGTAFANVALTSVPNFTGLTASGNTTNWVNVVAGVIPMGASVAIGPQNGVNGALRCANTITVSSGATLALAAGCSLKFAFDAQMVVSGTLDASGTTGQPVSFTEERDDTVGGDGNGDAGATAPAAGFWRGLNFQAGAGGTLDHARVRYGGRFISALELTSSNPIVRNTVIEAFTSAGIDLNATSRPTLTNVALLNCGGAAIESAPIQALPGFTGITASGNQKNWINVTSATVAAGTNVVVGPQNGIQGVVRYANSITVAAGGTLTFQPGAICKFGFDAQLNVSGLLLSQGTGAAQVYFTDERDDAVGGDSNTDGVVSLPSAAWWRGVMLNDTADGSHLAFTTIRYGGRFISGLELVNAAVTVNRCVISDFTGVGIDCNNSTEQCLFDHVRVDRCTGDAIDKVEINRVVDFIAATGAGNGANRLVVRSGTVSGTVTIDPVNQFLGSIALGGSLTIPQGAALNLQPGVVLKLGFDRLITVNGSFSVRGTLDEPVILTEERDDSVGGDSNGDGNGTVPGPGYWRGIDFSSTTDPSVVIGLEVRYGGRFIPNVMVRQPTVFMREVRSVGSSTDGFQFLAAGITPSRLIAVGNFGDGVEVAGGAFDVRQVTAVGNGGFGVRGTAGWSGRLLDSIVWNNAAGAFTGIGAGRVRYSNGDAALAGTVGNIFADPQFVNLASNDLRLQSTSPCINSGDPASPSDPDSTRADMGALFFNVCEPNVFCAQTAYPPCTPSFEYRGFASLSSLDPFWLRLQDSPTLSFAIFFYGIGQPISTPGAFGTLCVAGPFQRLAPIASGGNVAEGPCAGRFELDFNSYLRSGADPAIVVGSNVIGHFWYRYSGAPGNAAFSQAIEMPVCP
ncbi:MAG: hypothetical protein R3F49_09825 [Planctomycetota bacterium]